MSWKKFNQGHNFLFKSGKNATPLPDDWKKQLRETAAQMRKMKTSSVQRCDDCGGFFDTCTARHEELCDKCWSNIRGLQETATKED